MSGYHLRMKPTTIPTPCTNLTQVWQECGALVSPEYRMLQGWSVCEKCVASLNKQTECERCHEMVVNRNHLCAAPPVVQALRIQAPRWLLLDISDGLLPRTRFSFEYGSERHGKIARRLFGWLGYRAVSFGTNRNYPHTICFDNRKRDEISSE